MKLDSAYAYIIYGQSLEHFEEAVLSIGTLRRLGGERPILVLTDRPDRFPYVPELRTVSIDAPMLEQWMGESGYHFRIKLEGLRYLLRCYAEKIIFLDTDTLVRKDMSHWFSRIDDSNALLHKFEGTLGERRFHTHFCNVLNKTFTHADFGQFTIRGASPMYNSGVIGVSKAHMPCLEVALWLMDEVNARITSHNAEQMALGYVLSRHGKVTTVGDRNVFHYWYRDRGRYVKTQLTELLRHYSPLSVMSEPRIAKMIRPRRHFQVWLPDKLRRLRRKGIVRPLLKSLAREDWFRLP